ncbi:Phthiotriol/phenolphthiotriol dimycocerosates methyltransferase [Legionella massiliensis]|uniref:Phthiotriol/phenolphthiotriol dimycocerosates methyltransferase n=1 Tax=Legionella massiliensis TaxID=1034943 RepID=A0A078L3Z1_9GAMM|nr:class I SAM-dependent methyltransferase [Legionella massiliensis]CDZ78849.1 Phthiotriol/phenolphthiotriol dimycocerosates methyltransferase [Legionella massiliensis]CEE14587.1 Phthiotriol/phenolphthiotriol dimycocerosates methyltransferase [Legionella massiliensis]
MKSSKAMKIYRFLTRLSPYLRLVLVRWVYNKYATNNNSGKNIFLNYGYQDDTTLALKPEDEQNRFFIQLYHRVVQAIDLQGKDLAEIGCGQGAGGVYLVEYYKPRSYIGIDLSEKAIAFCQQHNQSENMQWLQGSADKLPIPDESVDVVINVESSHLYPSMEGFISEVQRILRPKGYLAFADLRQRSQVEALDKCFSDSGMQRLERFDITPQVLRSLAGISDRRKAHINATYPAIWRHAACEISAVKGSAVYNGFINGEQKYLCYLLQKL